MDIDAIGARLQEASRNLNETRTVQPGTPRSQIPLVGPILAGVRRAWNQVFSRWLVEPLVDNVNTFNETVARAFDKLAVVLVDVATQVTTVEEQVTAIQEQVAAVQQQVTTCLEKSDEAGASARDLSGPDLSGLRLARAYWDDQAAAGLLRAKEEILARFPGEEEAAFLQRFEQWGASDAKRLAPYYDPASRVLEIGCGIGRILKYVQAQERWGLDISQGLLNWARSHLEGEEGVHLVQTNGWDFQGLPNDYFDLVYSFIVLQHINKQAGFNYMRETYRVLKPNGRFFFQLMNLLCDQGFEVFIDTLTHEYPLYLYTPEEVDHKLTRIGFQVDELYTAEDGIYVRGHKPSG